MKSKMWEALDRRLVAINNGPGKSATPPSIRWAGMFGQEVAHMVKALLTVLAVLFAVFVAIGITVAFGVIGIILVAGLGLMGAILWQLVKIANR